MLTDASRSTPSGAQMGEFDRLAGSLVIFVPFFSEREIEALRDIPIGPCSAAAQDRDLAGTFPGYTAHVMAP